MSEGACIEEGNTGEVPEVYERKMTDHGMESTFEFSAFMKAGIMESSEKDSRCSDVDEDSRSSLHSPTASEDSVEVQVTPISLRNKRKLAEPRKIQEPAVIATPLKKRRFEPISKQTTVNQDETRSLSASSPFRPWIPISSKNEESKTTTTSTTTSTSITTTMTVSNTTTTASSTKTSPEKESEKEEEGNGEEKDEILERLNRSGESIKRLQHSPSHNRAAILFRRPHLRSSEPVTPTTIFAPSEMPHSRLQIEPLSLVVRDEAPRVPSHPAVSGTYEKTPSYMMEHLLSSSSHNHQSHHNHQDHQAISSSSSLSRHQHQGGQQRNYKNMTRERRIEANARERTRVHTISAAFETLRRAIPAYSHNQKLSKLSVLRIACSYIMTLSKVLEKDDEVAANANNGLTPLADCVDLVSRTIQTEGKLRKRKDD